MSGATVNHRIVVAIVLHGIRAMIGIRWLVIAAVTATFTAAGRFDAKTRLD
jgi:hypothetical protein